MACLLGTDSTNQSRNFTNFRAPLGSVFGFSQYSRVIFLSKIQS